MRRNDSRVARFSCYLPFVALINILSRARVRMRFSLIVHHKVYHKHIHRCTPSARDQRARRFTPRGARGGVADAAAAVRFYERPITI